MPSSEGIDWGLRRLITEWTSEDGTKYLYDFSKAIREYLHSQGVGIIKLPENPYQHSWMTLERDIFDRALHSIEIEPLIKEE